MFTNNKLSKAVRLAMVFGAATTMAFAGNVIAQETEEEEVKKDGKTERIQVVGSRIRTDGIDNATPLEIISADIAKDQGLSTLGELLRTSTVAAGSDQLISAYSVGFVTNGGAGAESISMRGLGANRTLVLLNGRRAGPAGTRGTVSAFDMNALPVSAIERVEILKDGASSLYGSDAVAGVINIITKKGDDASINVSGSKPFESGGETYRINGTYGTTFDRGSWRVVADHNVNTGLQRGDREFFDCQERYLFNASTGERQDPIDPRTGQYHCTDSGPGLFNLGGGRFQYDYTNFGFPTVSSTNTTVTQNPAGWYWAGHTPETDGWLDGLHPFRLKQTMIPESTVSSLFLQGDYDLTDSVSVYGELLHSSRQTDISSARQFWTADIGFVPINLAPGWSGTTRVLPVALTDHFSSETTINYSRAVLGFEGSFNDWTWDISWQRTHNSGDYEQDIIIRDSMLMAQNALLGGPCAGEKTPLTGLDCVQVNWFTPEHINGQFSDEVRGFLFGRDIGKTIYKQDTVDGYMTGDLFELPAGMVGAAIGASIQTDMIVDTPGVETRRGNSWGLSSAGITAGSANTKAVYAETQIPLLRDLPLIESFDLTASGRWTDVNTYGSDTTYKVSANWSLGHGFRVRASRGTSFRAPALFELYLEGQTGFLGQTVDPCVNYVESTNPLVRQNCKAAGIPESYIAGVGGSMTTVTGGGAGVLEAETSVSKGMGLIYTSPESKFAASVDYYDVTISDQVSSVAGAAVLSQCYTSENFANEPFCRQIDRRTGVDGDWGVAEVRGGYLNTAEQKVRGVDFKATYQDTFSYGDLRVVWNHTNQIERSFQQFSDSDRLYYITRVGNPKHVGTLATTVTRDDWQFNWNISYYSKTSNYHLYQNGNNTTLRGVPVTFVAETPTYILHAASVSYSYGDNLDVTVGLANMFDKQPPVVSPTALSVVGNVPLFASQLDYLGRRAFFNMTYTF
ncbi:TonB-dependent receptor domain-containing protein [Rheinheimera sp. UJ63]|uniref:TonB-dependent receptor domain-containing protein n=1 Tax=Rheinheimera sp. UJ63 TaxID=2910157 RepID=UPI001F3C72C0|nr:TonB-dependent receptor [Rheinheimera sp. UJ63]MCF4008056.1 TonB-dependent receptor [Rheinheimera sp. UJ63]